MKKELKRKFEILGIAVVYLFGSRATGRQSPLSDIDIGVVLQKAPSGNNTRTLYNNLYELFTEKYPASRLDIVFLQEAPLSLQYTAVREGKILFETDPNFTVDYENRVMNQYLDFRPVLDYFDRVTMERYAKA
ncbi:MAG: nucleotidyltransferase domain-containing protein [Smithella sp.]|jgi:predicted nucleotidyltransferase